MRETPRRLTKPVLGKFLGCTVNYGRIPCGNETASGRENGVRLTMLESDSNREGTRVCHVERAAMTATVLADAICWLCLRWDDGSIGWARACDYCQSPSGHSGDPCSHCGYSRRFTTVLEQVLGSLGAFRPD